MNINSLQRMILVQCVATYISAICHGRKVTPEICLDISCVCSECFSFSDHHKL